jgi:hypothetical protein
MSTSANTSTADDGGVVFRLNKKNKFFYPVFISGGNIKDLIYPCQYRFYLSSFNLS